MEQNGKIERIAETTKTTNTMRSVAAKPVDWGGLCWGEPGMPLTIQELACAMYEGMRQVHNLAEQCARAYGSAQALTFFDMMGDDVQNFWRGIAKQIIDHSRHWKDNEASACVLDDEETARLAALPRIAEVEQ